MRKVRFGTSHLLLTCAAGGTYRPEADFGRHWIQMSNKAAGVRLAAASDLIFLVNPSPIGLRLLARSIGASIRKEERQQRQSNGFGQMRRIQGRDTRRARIFSGPVNYACY